MTRFVVSMLLGLSLPTLVWAERTPDQGPEDERIRTVTYNPRDVVKVIGHYGYHTVIEFSEGEEIESILIGDSVAWQVIPTKRGNTIAVKPTETNASTNLTVISDRRTYAFALQARKGIPGPDMTWRLQFRYPEDVAAARMAELEQARIERAALVSPDVAAGPRDTYNFNYSYAGSRHLAPEVLFDDGEFTYFRFKAGIAYPAIFAVDEDKNESLLNHTIAGEYVKVHRVAAQFSLRRGDRLTCVFNEDRTDTKATPIAQPVARRTKPPADEAAAPAASEGE